MSAEGTITARSAVATTTIDGCAFHDWPSVRALTPFMSAGMAQLVEGQDAPMNVRGMWLLDHPLGKNDPAAASADGPAGSDPTALIEQLLGDRADARVVLGYDDALLATLFPLRHVAAEVIRAANDWTAEEWLARDDRLAAHILVHSSIPDEAASEIRRVGSDDRFVAVALGLNGLGRPFGHAAYRPIFEAAAEMDLPIVIQASSEAGVDNESVPVSGGVPATWTELDVLAFQPLATHVTSIILAGLFDEFPRLRVLLLGGGVAWVPGHLLRVDYWFKIMRRIEAPWLRDLPSEYFRQHVSLSTYSLESPRRPEELMPYLRSIRDLERMLVYTSGYPNRDGEASDALALRLPRDWDERVFRDNAQEFYRWPVRSTSSRTDRQRSATSTATSGGSQ